MSQDLRSISWDVRLSWLENAHSYPLLGLRMQDYESLCTAVTC